MEDRTQTRKERRFIYQDGTHVVIGHTNVRYEPNPIKDVYGSIEVTIDFPKKVNNKITFQLSLYPIPLDKNADARSNITPLEMGITNLFIESNKVIAGMIRNITGLKLKEYDHNCLGAFKERSDDDDDDDIILPDGSVYKSYTSNGAVQKTPAEKDLAWLRKGDKIMLASCLEIVDDTTSKSSYVWECKYIASKAKRSFFDRVIRKRLWKTFKPELYKKRYTSETQFTLGVEEVYYSDIVPVERETEALHVAPNKN